MKRILFVATVDNFFKTFYLEHFKVLNQYGWEIDVASKGELEFEYVRNKYNLSIERSPLKLKNIKGLKQLQKIVDTNNYDIIHCHTPMGSVLSRLIKRGDETNLIYTAHGFHFYKGSGLLSWLFYYPIEKYLSSKTSLLFTINEEDYVKSINKFKKTRCEKIKGVGINLSKFTNPNTVNLKGYFKDVNTPFITSFAGELNNNKNQIFLIKAFREVVKKNPNIVLALLGKGKNEKKYLKAIKKYKLTSNIKLLGYRNDIPSIFNESDVIISSSKREGQGLNLIEGMSLGKIILASRNRGHCDFINNGENGFLFDINNKKMFIKNLLEIFDNYNSDESKRIKDNAVLTAKKFSVDIVNKELLEHYEKLISK